MKQIIAVGGRTGTTEDALVDRYIIGQARRRRPAICGLCTAVGDEDAFVAKFFKAFAPLNCQPSHLSLFGRVPDLRSQLLEQDVIYVSGGNTKSMLAVWREWGLPELLREAWETGVVLAGFSAGAVCWFEQGISDAYSDQLVVLPCLGLLPGSCCPHYSGEPERRPYYRELARRGEIAGGLGIDDGAAAHFVGRKLERAVAARPGAAVYRVELREGAVAEDPLPLERPQ